MSNVVNLNEYKSKKNRLEDVQIAKKYLYSLDENSLEIEIADKVMDLVYEYERANIRLNFTQIAKEKNISVYKVKKAYKNLLDNKVLIEVAKEPSKPVLVSSKNIMIAFNFTDYIKALL